LAGLGRSLALLGRSLYLLECSSNFLGRS
jgi:hypothetical protein